MKNRLRCIIIIACLIFVSLTSISLYGQKPLRSLEDLNHKDIRIGVLIATWQENYAREHFPQARIIPLTNTTDLIALLRNRDCDVVFLARPVCLYILEESPDLAFLSEQAASTSVSVGFSPEDTLLRPKFNQFLKELIQNGIHTQMVDRWLERTDGTMPDFPESNKINEIIRIGTTCMDVPFTFYQDNHPAGFDVEMARRFAARMNKKPEFVISDFSGMLAGMSAGKIDMMINYIMVTEERSKKFSFSDSYLTTWSSMITLQTRIQDTVKAEKSRQNIGQRFYNNLIRDKRYMLLLDGLLITLLTALLSALGGTLTGGLICFMRMSRWRAVYLLARIYIAFFRGIPQVVMLMLMYYVVFASTGMNGVSVSVITFSLIFGAYVSEMFRSSIQSVPKGQSEAGIALGFSRIHTFVYIVLPQAIRRVYPVFKGELIALTKLTSIVGYIAVQDLTKASDLIRSRTFDAFFPLIVISVIYFVLAWGLARLLETALPTNIRQA
ncbi:MAG: ABC transporter substrate-binding protein/permease [Bacteroidales bacterium]|jgi:polar amino acid transport system substrate-binding protein